MSIFSIKGIAFALLLTLIISTLDWISPVQSAPVTPSFSNNLSAGWVYASHLSNLSPSQDRIPYSLLNQRRLAEAALGLQRELAVYPNSLSAFVGLMQAEPERWQDEINKLKGEIAQQRANHQDPASTDLFKLGTLLYYQRERGSNPPGQPWSDKQELEAQALLAQAWSNDHAPIIGLMLIEMMVTAGVPYPPSASGLTPVAIIQQLVEELAGPHVYAQYLRAEKSVWDAPPPAVSRVPKQNLRPLVAVVASLRSLYGRRSGVLRVINGKPTRIDNPVPASQLTHEHYLREWYDQLVAAIPAA